jgi:hypothetical protein
MAYADKAATAGRIPITIVDIYIDAYDASADLLPYNPDGTPCYGTPATTRGQGDRVITPRRIRFMSEHALQYVGIDGVVFPTLQSAEYKDDRLRPGEGIAELGTATITIRDHEDYDILDPFRMNGRLPEDAIERASVWRTLLARWPYHDGRMIVIHEGFAPEPGETFDPRDFIKRQFFITRIDGPDRKGQVKISAQSILGKLQVAKAEFPAASAGRLNAAITNTATTAVIDDADIAEEYPASGLAIIEDEIISYTRSGQTLTITRAQRGTTAAAHDIGASIQVVHEWVDARPHDMVYDIMTSVGVPAEYLDYTGWKAAMDDLRQNFEFSGIVSKPTQVTKLLTSIMMQAAAYMYWDPRFEPIDFAVPSFGHTGSGYSQVMERRDAAADALAAMVNRERNRVVLRSGGDYAPTMYPLNILYGETANPVIDEYVLARQGDDTAPLLPEQGLLATRVTLNTTANAYQGFVFDTGAFDSGGNFVINNAWHRVTRDLRPGIDDVASAIAGEARRFSKTTYPLRMKIVMSWPTSAPATEVNIQVGQLGGTYPDSSSNTYNIIANSSTVTSGSTTSLDWSTVSAGSSRKRITITLKNIDSTADVSDIKKIALTFVRIGTGAPVFDIEYIAFERDCPIAHSDVGGYIPSHQTLMQYMNSATTGGFDIVCYMMAYDYDQAIAAIGLFYAGKKSEAAWISRGLIRNWGGGNASSSLYVQRHTRNAHRWGPQYPSWDRDEPGYSLRPGWYGRAGIGTAGVFNIDDYAEDLYTGTLAWVVPAMRIHYLVGDALSWSGRDLYHTEGRIPIASDVRPQSEWMFDRAVDILYDACYTGAPYGGFHGGLHITGPSLPLATTQFQWASTEHACDMAAVGDMMRRKHAASADAAKWLDMAEEGRNFVNDIYIPSASPFIPTGKTDLGAINYAVLPSDCVTWGIYGAGIVDRDTIDETWRDTFALNSTDGVWGYSNVSFGGWMEGQAQHATALRLLGDSTQAIAAMGMITDRYVGSSDPRWQGTIVGTDQERHDTGFGWYYFGRGQLGATGWYLIACDWEANRNPFYLDESRVTPAFAKIESEGQVRMGILKPAEGWSQRITDADLLEPVDIKRDHSRRVSRLDAFIGMRAPLADPERDESYLIRYVPGERLIGPGLHEDAILKKEYCRFIPGTAAGISMAKRMTSSILDSLQDGEEEYTIIVTAELASKISIGDPVILETRDFIDVRGCIIPVVLWVASKEPDRKGQSEKITLIRVWSQQGDTAGLRYMYLMGPADPATYADASAAQRDPGGYLAASGGDMPGGDSGYRLW